MNKVNGMERLDALKIRSEKVLVGERELVARTSSMMQQKALVEALGKIDPSTLLSQVSPVLAAAGSSNFASVLVSMGPLLYKSLMEFLSESASVAVAEAAGAILDNEQNFRVLRDEEKAVTDDQRTMEGRRYVESTALREWVRDTITPAQAFDVISVAIGLNDYRRLGGALASLVMGAMGAAKTSAPVPDSSGTPTT